MPLPAARRFNRRITIERAVRTDNGAGGNKKSFAAPVTVWAEMIALRGAEALQHQILHAMQLWKVTIRFRDGVDEDARAMFAGEALNIRSCVDPDGKRRELVMTCESGVRT